MGVELDRQIAELIMGESEPPVRYAHRRGRAPKQGDKSPGGNWLVESRRGYSAETWVVWQPLPFSTNLDQAMRALKSKLRELGGRVHLAIDEQGVVAWDGWGNKGKPGATIPEAICNLLLVLTKREKEK